MTIQQHASFDSSAAELNATSRLVKAWESKNAKNAAKAGGISLMALSLAACGGSDTPAITQAQLDAEKAAATAAAAAQAAAEAKAAAAAAAQAAAEADAATAAEAQAAAEAAQAAAEADAAAAAVAQAAAEAAQAAQAAAKALVASTSDDILSGGSGDDTFTATSATLVAADIVIDDSSTDADVATLTLTGAAPASTLRGIETINVNINNLASVAVDATNYSGVTTLNVTRGDLDIGGTTLTGNKAVDVDGLDGSEVANVVAGASTSSVAVTQLTAGTTVNADAASGTVAVDGAATISANGAGASDQVTVAALTTVSADTTAAVENAKAVSITTSAVGTAGQSAGNSAVSIGALTGDITVNANSALNVDIANTAGTGAIVVNAAAADRVEVDSALGGATVVAGTSSAVDVTAIVNDIDASGATITVGTGVELASGVNMAVQISGVSGALDEAATIVGNGFVTVTNDSTDVVNVLTLQGSTADVTFNIAGASAAATSYTAAGDYKVSIETEQDLVTGKTITGVETLTLSAAGTVASLDLSKASVAKTVIEYSVDNNTGAAETITAVSGSSIEFIADQSALTFANATGATAAALNITAGDVNGATTTVGTLSVGAFATGAGATLVGDVTITANEANFTATGTTIGGKQNLTLVGDEDFTLGTVAGGTATVVNASEATGIISLTTTTLAPTVTTGTGADIIVVNGDDVHTISSGAGIDTITITDTQATSTFDAGAGNDNINLRDTNAYVVIGGDGDDTFTADAATPGIDTAIDIDAVLIGGSGSDTLVTGAKNVGALTLSDNANFAMSGIEKINFTADDIQFNNAQVTGQTLSLIANGDAFTVAMKATGGTLDASGISIASGSTAAIAYTGSDVVDTITGGKEAEGFTQSKGADVLDGGAGTDTYTGALLTETGSTNATTGIVVNLSSAAIAEATILGKAGMYLGGTSTGVAAGTVEGGYAADLAGNVSLADTVSNIETFVGTTGRDYFQGSAGAETFTGGTGNDYIKTGLGSDTINVAFGGQGVDVIADFTAGAGGDVFTFTGSSDVVSTANLDADGFLLTTAAASAVIADGLTILDNGVATVADLATLDAAGLAAVLADSDLTGGAGAAFTYEDDSDVFYIVASDGTDAGIFKIEDATAGSTAIAAADITLIATLEGITDAGTLTADNFTGFA